MSPTSLYGITGPQLSNPSCWESYGGNTLPREYGVIALGSQRSWREDTHVSSLNIEL